MSAINNQNVDTLLSRINSLNLGTSYEAQGVKDELEVLFTETNTMNAGDNGASKIAEKIADLEEKIGELEEKAQKIMDKIEEKNAEVKSKQNNLIYTTSEITSAMAKFQKETANAARYAAEDAIHSYRMSSDSSSFQECFDQAFRKRLGGLQANQTELIMLWQLYESNRGAVVSISSDIESAINKVQGYESQLKNVNATIQLLTSTKNAMIGSTVENAYTNYDLDASVPIFSGAKEKVANEIIALAGNLAKGTINVDDSDLDIDANVINAGDAETDENTGDGGALSIDALKSTYSAKNEGTAYNSVWYATLSKNPQLQNLCERINDDNMLENLQQAGMSADDILSFVSENWQVGLKRTENADGSINYVIPNNAGGEEAVYSKLNALALSTQTENDAAEACIKSMQQTALEALDKMYNAGFTFKEAMYTLSIAYPNSGIEYSLANQLEERNYAVPEDSEQTGTLYQDISDKIQQYWFVTAETSEVQTFAARKIATTRGHYDPIVFQEGNTTFTFITDRDNDGKFDFTDGENNELLGSKEGISELLAFDYNGDGIIDENDIDENGNTALDNLLLISNYQDESVNTPDEIEAYKASNIFENVVDFNISYTTAKDAGITSIDLSAIKETGRINGEDNVEENYTNVNGSNLINQFTITKDGNQITADETLNTEANLNTFYGQLAAHSGNAGTISTIQSEVDFENIFNSESINSETITNILETLKEMKNSPDSGYKYGDITLTEDDIHIITSHAYLTGVMLNAERAAEDKIDHKKEAKDAAEEAVNDYFENRILKSSVLQETETSENEEEDEDKDKKSEDEDE